MTLGLHAALFVSFTLLRYCALHLPLFHFVSLIGYSQDGSQCSFICSRRHRWVALHVVTLEVPCAVYAFLRAARHLPGLEHNLCTDESAWLPAAFSVCPHHIVGHYVSVDPLAICEVLLSCLLGCLRYRLTGLRGFLSREHPFVQVLALASIVQGAPVTPGGGSSHAGTNSPDAWVGSRPGGGRVVVLLGTLRWPLLKLSGLEVLLGKHRPCLLLPPPWLLTRQAVQPLLMRLILLPLSYFEAHARGPSLSKRCLCRGCRWLAWSLCRSSMMLTAVSMSWRRS